MGAAMRYQPQGRVRLGIALLNAGCKLAFSAGSLTDAASGKISSAPFKTIGWPGGVAFCPASQSEAFPTFATIPVKTSGSFTVLVYGTFIYSNGPAPLVAHTNGTGGWKFTTNGNNLGYTQYGVADYASAAQVSGSGLQVPTVVAIVVTPGVNAKFYKNGFLVDTIAIGAMGASGNGTLVIGNRSTGDTITTSQIAGAYYVESGLSDAQIAALSRSFWQPFDAGSSSSAYQSAIAIAAASGGATPVAISGAWLEQNDSAVLAASASAAGSVVWAEASDLLTAVASIKVSASAALAEANDTTAISASVGSAVAIAASWTETSDTASVIASAGIASTTAWVEANDTATLSATVGGAVTATAALVEQNDVCAVLATVKVSATAGWAEASDLSGFSASVLASAGIAWSESADVLSAAASVAVAGYIPVQFNALTIAPTSIAVSPGGSHAVTSPGGVYTVRS